MEIKILVKLNERTELEKIIETCKEHGMELTREGGGKLPNFSGYYAELKGVRWQKVETGERLLTIPDVIKSICPLCRKNEPIEGYTVCLSCMEDSVK